MSKFSFQLHTLDDLILVEASVNDYPLILALDTAASQSVMDWNALYLAGCPVPKPSENDEMVSVETAAGIIEVPLYVVEQLNALGVTRNSFQVLTYDFLEKGFRKESFALCFLTEGQRAVQKIPYGMTKSGVRSMVCFQVTTQNALLLKGPHFEWNHKSLKINLQKDYKKNNS